jgi:hypothetical protein
MSGFAIDTTARDTRQSSSYSSRCYREDATMGGMVILDEARSSWVGCCDAVA